MFGKNIGTAHIERFVTEKDSTEQYLLQSSTVADVFFVKKHSSQNYIVTYKHGKLIKSAASNTVNDETTFVSLNWDIDRYILKKNKHYSYLHEPVFLSTLCIYFHQPDVRFKYFSERLGEFYFIVKNKDGSYEYTLSDGIRNVFYYQGNSPELIVMKKSFVTVEMKLTKVE
ncbi:MAG: hypothetical protein KIS94_03375 [Chitinophagales bacterium]|nr:hypothetical protein [Chitinophagales bacterium]